MTFAEVEIIVFLIYRILILLIGLLIFYWGYILFSKQIFNSSGDIQVSYNEIKFSLKNSAPGTIIMILGTIIIFISIYKGWERHSQTFSSKENNKVQLLPPNIDSMPIENPL